MAIDWSKPIRSRRNFGYEYVYVGSSPDRQKHAIWGRDENKSGEWVAGTYTDHAAKSMFENVPERREWWLAMTRGGEGLPGCLAAWGYNPELTTGCETWHIIEDGDTVTVTKVKA